MRRPTEARSSSEAEAAEVEATEAADATDERDLMDDERRTSSTDAKSPAPFGRVLNKISGPVCVCQLVLRTAPPRERESSAPSSESLRWLQVRCELVVLRNSRHSAHAVGGLPRFGTSCSGRSACLHEFWRCPRVQASHEYCRPPRGRSVSAAARDFHAK